MDAAANEAAGWAAGDDAPGRCPIVSSQVPTTDRAHAGRARAAIVDERGAGEAARALTVIPAALTRHPREGALLSGIN